MKLEEKPKYGSIRYNLGVAVHLQRQRRGLVWEMRKEK